ncbi:MAG TPA: transcription antitermination factor NusB [Actinomycetales bacterium]
MANGPTRGEGRGEPRIGSRTKARKRAMDVLFEADQRGVAALEVLAARQAAADPALNAYTVTAVRGVVERQDRLDELISTYAQGWTLDRMPAVDRALLRLGAWEVLYSDEVPDAVAVDEAIVLARSLSTDDSPGFVAGLLGRLIDLKPTLAL